MIGGTFSVVQWADEEVHDTPEYRLDNASRTDGAALVIQRTVRGTAFFEDAAGRRLVPPGYTMLFSHNEPSQYGYAPESETAHRLQFIAFSPAASVNPIFVQLRRDFGSVVRMSEDSEGIRLFLQLIQRFRARSFQDRFHETEILTRLLIALYREQVANTRTSDPIEFGRQYLQNQFRQPFNLKLVAQKCGVSREHFVREFTKRYGEAPGSILRGLRLEHARSMLNTAAVSIEEVALASGFANVDTFSRAYRRTYGLSPEKARARSP